MLAIRSVAKIALCRDDGFCNREHLCGRAESEHIAEPAIDGKMYLVRGGNHNVTDARDFRAASRDQALPYLHWEHIGFRVVADLPEPRLDGSKDGAEDGADEGQVRAAIHVDTQHRPASRTGPVLVRPG